MNKYRWFTCIILGLYVLLIITCNALMLGSLRNKTERQYMVDIKRAVDDINGGASIESVCGEYASITRISLFDPKSVINSEYVVKPIGDDLYTFEYQDKANILPLIYMNAGLGIALISVSFVLIYIGRKILRPFHKMSDYSVQLARGNLSAPVKEDKNKFFGKFLWGINMLRDDLESKKERELELQKDKKTLILSLSHDIKTPLSAIKLYSRALDEDIYETDAERKEAVAGIAHNAEEIEKYVSDIVAASKGCNIYGVLTILRFCPECASVANFIASSSLLKILLRYKNIVSVFKTVFNFISQFFGHKNAKTAYFPFLGGKGKIGIGFFKRIVLFSAVRKHDLTDLK